MGKGMKKTLFTSVTSQGFYKMNIDTSDIVIL